MNNIKSLIHSQKYREALQLINDKIQKQNQVPLPPEFWQVKANVEYFLGDYTASLHSAELAIKLQVQDPWIYARKGLSLFHLQNYEQSKIYLDKSIRQGIQHSEILFFYGLCCHRLGFIEDSKISLKKAIELNRNLIFKDWGIASKDTSVKSILKDRLHQWLVIKNPKFSNIVELLNKDKAKHYIQKKGFLSPKTLLITSDVKDLRLSHFPNRIVIKPEDGHGAQGVLVIDNGIDLFNLIKIPHQLGKFLNDKVLKYSHLGSERVIFEELIEDVDYENNPYLKIPRDFKVFAADGKVFWIGVYNRNAREGLRSLVEYDLAWNRLPTMSTALIQGATENKPKFFDDLIRQAEEISRDFPYVMRLDFYISNKGVVFGEFTPNPNAGFNLTELGERVLQQLFFIYPDIYD